MNPVYTGVGIRCFKLLDLSLITKELKQSVTISNLNSRLFMLRRLARVISRDRLKRLSDSLYTSKIRYGIQLFGKVRLSESDPTDGLMECLQIAQNRFARFMHGSTLTDRINNQIIYQEVDILSVNQLNAQTKLLEWMHNFRLLFYIYIAYMQHCMLIHRLTNWKS